MHVIKRGETLSKNQITMVELMRRNQIKRAINKRVFGIHEMNTSTVKDEELEKGSVNVPQPSVVDVRRGDVKIHNEYETNKVNEIYNVIQYRININQYSNMGFNQV